MKKPINRFDRRPDNMLSSGHVDVILVEPQLAENVGAAARAIANMGLGRLILINPKIDNWDLVKANATIHAERVVKNILIFDNFIKAIGDYDFLVGTTARVGAKRGPFFSPRQLASEIHSRSNNYQKVGLVFGAERTGLLTEHLRYCQKVVRIPTADPESSSLNLGQAVLLLGYELIVSAGGEVKEAALMPASQKELIYMYEDLSETLIKIGFFTEHGKDYGLMNIKKIFNRSLLTSGECNLLLGISKHIKIALKNKEK